MDYGGHKRRCCLLVGVLLLLLVCCSTDLPEVLRCELTLKLLGETLHQGQHTEPRVNGGLGRQLLLMAWPGRLHACSSTAPTTAF